ncbi:MAG: hypothetical protein K0Q90_1392 [Paenibacillaceae bacterium]|jgi:hypothetical protein|nr:hypothetical protein [Paenibacillaceae bacterium]
MRQRKLRSSLSHLLLSAGVVGLLVLLAGCGTAAAPAPGVDLNPYTIDFSADPAVPRIGSPVALEVKVNGKEKLSKRSEVYFDLKKKDSTLELEIKAESNGDNRFAGAYTFKEAGFYEVSIHVITRTAHQTEVRQLEVKP